MGLRASPGLKCGQTDTERFRVLTSLQLVILETSWAPWQQRMNPARLRSTHTTDSRTNTLTWRWRGGGGGGEGRWITAVGAAKQAVSCAQRLTAAMSSTGGHPDTHTGDSHSFHTHLKRIISFFEASKTEAIIPFVFLTNKLGNLLVLLSFKASRRTNGCDLPADGSSCCLECRTQPTFLPGE